MLRLLWIYVLVPTVCGEAAGTTSSHYLNAALSGFDPHVSDISKNPDPGRRAQIFEPLDPPTATLLNERHLNPFIQEIRESKCIPELFTHTVRNYDEYRGFLSSAYEFASKSQCIDTFGPPVNFDEDVPSCQSRTHRYSNERAMQQFFKEIAGEIIFVTAECITQTVNLAPFVKPTFTPAFQAAVAAIYKAAQNPHSERSGTEVVEFINAYGTHFSSVTRLGSKVILGKLFSKLVTTASEEESRRRCMYESAYETLTPGTRRNNETTLSHFTRASSKRCGGGEQEVIAVAIGPLPENSLNDWAETAKAAPKPIFYHLEKMSAIFNRGWFGEDNNVELSINFDNVESSSNLKHVESSSNFTTALVNKTVLYQYFEDKLSDYCSTMFGSACLPRPRGCGINSRCDAGTKCVDEPNTDPGYKCVDKYGGIVIVGGQPSSATEGWGVAKLPNPYSSVCYGNTLSIVGLKVYSCGGTTSSCERRCYRLYSSSYSYFDTPWRLSGHSAVSVSDEIWFFQKSKLYIYHTSIFKFSVASTRAEWWPHDTTTSSYSEFNLIFSFNQYVCAVTNGSHVFVIGAGSNKDEVWVNLDTSRPSEWEKYTKLLNTREMHACLWFGPEIFVSGGKGKSNDYSTSSVEVITVENKTIRSTGPLVQTRRLHQMAVIDGKPAVLGGHSTQGDLASIETYDSKSNAWQMLDYSMELKRREFGLAQFRT